jgi:hypothetical protein
LLELIPQGASSQGRVFVRRRGEVWESRQAKREV